jgi:hypothetical protein
MSLEVQLLIIKGPSILYSSNQEINPSVGNQQLHVEAIEDLVEISTPNKSKPPSLQPQPKPTTHAKLPLGRS